MAEILMILQMFSARFMVPNDPNESLVLKGKWTELRQIWAWHSPIITAHEVLLDFWYVVPHRNEGDSKATMVKNEAKFYTFNPRPL